MLRFQERAIPPQALHLVANVSNSSFVDLVDDAVGTSKIIKKISAPVISRMNALRERLRVKDNTGPYSSHNAFLVNPNIQESQYLGENQSRDPRWKPDYDIM